MTPPPLWTVEVQHSSDGCHDGIWHELERVDSEASADALIRYFGQRSRPPKGLRPADCQLTGSYAGRPLRKRKVDE